MGFVDLPKIQACRGGHETPHRFALHAVIRECRGYQLKWRCELATDQTPVAASPLWSRFLLWRRVILQG